MKSNFIGKNKYSIPSYMRIILNRYGIIFLAFHIKTHEKSYLYPLNLNIHNSYGNYDSIFLPHLECRVQCINSNLFWNRTQK